MSSWRVAPQTFQGGEARELVWFQVYPITGQSEVSRERWVFQDGYRPESNEGSDGKFPCCRTVVARKKILGRSLELSLCLQGTSIIYCNLDVPKVARVLTRGHSSSGPRFSDKRLSEPGVLGNETKANPPADVPALHLDSSPRPTRGGVASSSIVQCAGVLRQRAGGCGMMRLVSETWARVPSPQLWFRDPSTPSRACSVRAAACSAGLPSAQMSTAGRAAHTPALYCVCASFNPWLLKI